MILRMVSYFVKKKKKINILANFRNFAIPLEWKSYVYILTTEYAFDIENKRGSCRVFVRGSERFTADEPHGKGDKNVSKEDRKKAIRALIRIGAISEYEEDI